MCPQHTDPNVNYRRIHELSEEFEAHWHQLRSLYLDASVGFSFISQHMEALQAKARSYVRGTELDSEEFQDTCNFSYSEIFSENFVMSDFLLEKQGAIKKRNRPDGQNYITLGQFCVVSFYAFWSEYLRREYAIAKGLLSKDESDKKVIDKILADHVSHDLWGDIGLLRNSIVHNRGIASSKTEKCKIIKWFKPGDVIAITPAHMRVLLLAMYNYHNELFSEQFRPHYIQL